MAGFAGVVPDFPADLVQRVGRELDHVERVHAAARRSGIAARALPLIQSAMSQDTSSSCSQRSLPEQIQELLDRLAVAAGSGPHQPAGVVVDHDGQVPMALSDRDLIDPRCASRPANRSRCACASIITRAQIQPTDLPGDAHQLRDRFLGRVAPPAMQPDLQSCYVKAGSCRAHGTAATTTRCLLAVHARRVGLQVAPTWSPRSSARQRRRPSPSILALHSAGGRPDSGASPALRGLTDTTTTSSRSTRSTSSTTDRLDPEQQLPYPSWGARRLSSFHSGS